MEKKMWEAPELKELSVKMTETSSDCWPWPPKKDS